MRQEAAAKEALADLKRQMVHKDDWIQQLESKLDNFRKFRDLLIEEPNSVNRQLAIDHPNPTTAGNVAAGRVGGRARIDPLFVNNAINRVLNPNATTVKTISYFPSISFLLIAIFVLSGRKRSRCVDCCIFHLGVPELTVDLILNV